MLKKILLLALLPAIAFAEELPAPVKAIEKQGITIIKTFDAPGGMKGYLGKYQDMGVTIYLTPDGKHAISGYMYGTVAKLAMRQPFVLFKGLTFQKLCLP
ncbi:disulfide isomerase DsbC N-terminal domain-containing protein, partial [Escherichia coli]